MMEMFRYRHKKVGKLDDWEKKILNIVKDVIDEDRIEYVIWYDDGAEFGVDKIKASEICKIYEATGIDVEVYAEWEGETGLYIPKQNYVKG